MSDDRTDIDVNALEEMFSVRMRWATLNVTIQEIADDNKTLVRELKRYDPKTAVPLLSALLTLPKYQSQCTRIEILVALAVAHCEGHKKAKIEDISRWFTRIEKSLCVIGEDPAEDVFVSLAHDQNGNYRILEGVWESAGFYAAIPRSHVNNA